MGDNTGIGWTDSTFNPWIGCFKVGPGCDTCYAEAWDKRYNGGEHWGQGAPRRRTSIHNWNNPRRWNRKADEFFAQHGRKRRVFCASLADVFDNEVNPIWRQDLWFLIEETPNLEYQICTKRVSNIPKMLPEDWGHGENYRHVGFLITCVNQEEAGRDIPRLMKLKERFGFAWIGISYEPALGRIVWPHKWFEGPGRIDWIICGGESSQGGVEGRDDDPSWYRGTLTACRLSNTAFYMKQMARLAPIPEDLLVHEFPNPASKE